MTIIKSNWFKHLFYYDVTLL